MRTSGHIRAAAWLLDMGASPDAVDSGGCTPLRVAAEYNRKGMVLFLFFLGVYPLCVAAEYNRKGMIFFHFSRCVCVCVCEREREREREREYVFVY